MLFNTSLLYTSELSAGAGDHVDISSMSKPEGDAALPPPVCDKVVSIGPVTFGLSSGLGLGSGLELGLGLGSSSKTIRLLNEVPYINGFGSW